MPKRPLVLLAVVAVVALPSPAGAVRPDAPTPAVVVDEWTTSGDFSRLPDQAYSRVEVTYDATYGITLDGRLEVSVASFLSWSRPAQWAALNAVPTFERPVVDVTGGTSFGMALDDRGRLHTWGDAPTISAQDRAATYRDVAAVSGSAVGVTTDGAVKFWGENPHWFEFPDGLPTAADDVVAIDIGSSAVVALTSDGRVLSGGGAITGEWNSDWSFPQDRADETFVAVDAGVEFATALTDQGEVVAWGVDHGGTGETTVPVLPAGRRAVAVSAGMWMAAAVLDDGSILRWGQGESTQLPARRSGLDVVDLDVDRYRVAVAYGSLAGGPAPKVTGAPRVGGTLKAPAAAPGVTTTYQWSRGDAPVAGATRSTYRPTAADLGQRLRVRVTSSRPGVASGAVDSVATAAVTLGPTRLTVATPRTAALGRAATITVSGLAPSEPFVVRVGAQRATGTASTKGVGTVTLRLTGAPGVRGVTVTGSMPDRAGTGSVRVGR